MSKVLIFKLQVGKMFFEKITGGQSVISIKKNSAEHLYHEISNFR